MTPELRVQIGINLLGTIVMCSGGYVGLMIGRAKLQVRVGECEKRLDRLEAPYFNQPQVQPK